MASKKKYTESYFIEMNVQNPPKPEFQWWYVRKADETSIFKHTVEGWEFTEDIRKDTLGKAEGFSPLMNFRMCFIPNPGHYWVSRDFEGQEIRILANLAMEQTWIKTILEGGDIHKETAIIVWGKENYTPKNRKAAKAINFGLVYGQSARGVADGIGCSEEEAQQHIDTYFSKLPSIKRYLDRCERQALKNQQIGNLYGRKRRLKQYMTPWGKMQHRGIRISYNFPIQSLGAEIIKLALIKMHKIIVKPKLYGDDFEFKNTIHDEANVSIAYGIVKEAVYKLGKVMEHRMPKKPVPITTGLEIGHSMGLLWKFNQDPDTLELTPEMEPLEDEALLIYEEIHKDKPDVEKIKEWYAKLNTNKDLRDRIGIDGMARPKYPRP